MAASNQMSELAGVLEAVKGKKTKTTQTSQTNISDRGVNQLIEGILSGPGGVRSIGTAARSTGLYDSTTEERELGKLYADAAVKAELARSPTTVSTVQETPGIGLGGAAAAIGGAQITKMMMGEENLISSGIDAVKGFFNPAPAVTAGTTAATTGASTAAATGAGAATTAAGVGSQAAGFMGANAIPLGGSFLSGLLSGKEAAKDPTSLATSALMGGVTMGPMGLIAAPAAALAGGFLKDSVICTALMERGLLTAEFHATGEDYLTTVGMATKVGYWAWGKPVAKQIKKGSKFWISLTLPVVKSYINFVANKDSSKLAAIKYPLGALAHYFGTPVCYAIGEAALSLQELKAKLN